MITRGRTINKRLIDRTKKGNRKCRNCNFWYKCDEDNRTFCGITNEDKLYYHRCKKFEWNSDLNYVQGPVDQEGDVAEEIDNIVTDDDTFYNTEVASNNFQFNSLTRAIVATALVGLVSLVVLRKGIG